MSDSAFPNNRQLESICNEFRLHWSADDRPDFNSFLKQVDDEHRDQLLRMLLDIDVELRLKAGHAVSAHDYRELGKQALAHVVGLLTSV